MTYQTDDTLKGRIATHRQIIAHCENEIKQLEGTLKARKVKSEQVQPLKLEVGKTYARADGTEVEIRNYNSLCVFPYQSVNHGSYKVDGGFGMEGRHDYDLIREVVKPKETAAEVIDTLSKDLVSCELSGFNCHYIADMLSRAIELKVKEMM